MSNMLGKTMTYYTYMSPEERVKMLAASEFICFYEDAIVAFDPSDGDFWAFGSTTKVRLSLTEVKKFPEVRLSGIKLKDFKKK